MSNNRARILASLSCIGVFCFLAAGSMNNAAPPPTASKQYDPIADAPTPQLDPKQTLINALHFGYKWSTDGVIMHATFTVDNPTTEAFKDIEIKCVHFAPSGTEIDSNTRTIYESFAPHRKKTIRNFNMGFINSQAQSSACKITDLVIQ